MKIFTASDRANRYGLAALLKSLDLSLDQDAEIFVASCGLSRSEQQTLERCCRFPVHWREFKPVKGVLSMAGSTLAYAKLQPLTYTTAQQRLIWLDSDMIVMRDLKPLQTLDLNGKIVAGVRNAEGNPNTSGISMAYLNTGLLVYDLERWKQNNLTQSLLANARTRLWADHDQGALNDVLTDQWVELDLQWNDYRTENRNTGIIHFISRPKPWEGRDRSQLWFEIFAQTPYQSEISRIQNLPKRSSGSRWAVYRSWLNEPLLRLKSYWKRRVRQFEA
jgi:lipopolysaccharide biosynthesis glycosyltransferase